LNISVVLNAHNEGEILANAIESALANTLLCSQLNIEVEVLVVLDKADPRTTSLAQSYSESVKIVAVEFGELAKSRNFGISKVTGDYVALLDGDDFWGRNWLLNCFQYARISDSDVLHPEFSVHFSRMRRRAGTFIQRHPSSRDPSFLPHSLVEGNPWTSLSFARRAIFLDNPYLENDKQSGIGFEDWSFNLQTLRQGIHHVPVPDTVHFIREKGASMKKSQQKADAIHALQSFRFE
jgi:glycosyltransferase involved in cell wall biosynthesis